MTVVIQIVVTVIPSYVIKIKLLIRVLRVYDFALDSLFVILV